MFWFNLWKIEKYIAETDEANLEFSAVKWLKKENEKLSAENRDLRLNMASMERMIASYTATIVALKKRERK